MIVENFFFDIIGSQTNYIGKETKTEKNWSKIHYSPAFISQKLTDEGAKIRMFCSKVTLMIMFVGNRGTNKSKYVKTILHETNFDSNNEMASVFLWQLKIDYFTC